MFDTKRDVASVQCTLHVLCVCVCVCTCVETHVPRASAIYWITKPLTKPLTGELFFFFRWVATFQHTLRMLWETHVHSTEEGVMRQDARGNSGQGGRQGSAEARGGASARDRGARGTVEGFSRRYSAGHAHLVVADVVPPFVEAPPL